MTKLGKYLKPFALSILAIVALLFTQAMCELAMRSHTLLTWLLPIS